MENLDFPNMTPNSERVYLEQETRSDETLNNCMGLEEKQKRGYLE